MSPPGEHRLRTFYSSHRFDQWLRRLTWIIDFIQVKFLCMNELAPTHPARRLTAPEFHGLA
jgi:hypothetical protein